jgi:hypothetical protein
MRPYRFAIEPLSFRERVAMNFRLGSANFLPDARKRPGSNAVQECVNTRLRQIIGQISLNGRKLRQRLVKMEPRLGKTRHSLPTGPESSMRFSPQLSLGRVYVPFGLYKALFQSAGDTVASEELVARRSARTKHQPLTLR